MDSMGSLLHLRGQHHPRCTQQSCHQAFFCPSCATDNTQQKIKLLDGTQKPTQLVLDLCHGRDALQQPIHILESFYQALQNHWIVLLTRIKHATAYRSTEREAQKQDTACATYMVARGPGFYRCCVCQKIHAFIHVASRTVRQEHVVNQGLEHSRMSQIINRRRIRAVIRTMQL